MAILTTAGRTAIAVAVNSRPLHLAWGTGSAGWDATPVAEPVGATALVAELGRRAVSIKRYVVANAGGDIIVPSGVYSESPGDAPTNSLYLRTNFDYADSPTAVIREVGLFMDTTLASGLGGISYFTGGQVTSPGILVSLQRITRIDRSGSVRQAFEFVLTF